MGNQLCSAQGSIRSENLRRKNELNASIENTDKLETKCSQNLEVEGEEMEENSPFSRFDIKFLKTNVRASNVQQHSLPAPSISKNQGLKIFSSLSLSSFSETQKHKILQWVIKQKSNSSKSGKQNQMKRKLTNLFLIQASSQISKITSSQYLHIKINGDAFYKIRNQSINPYYQVDKKIGEGSFGSVYKGRYLKTGDLRAIKILKKKIMNENDEKSLLSQINILKKMDHINIIKLYDVFYYNNFFYVITQYCEGGSLLQALQNHQIKSEKDIAILMKQIASAISYMHQMKIAHRDLKLDNIVLVKNMKRSNKKTCVKIIDFGLAQQVEHPFRNHSGIVGTLSYMAPEIFSGTFSCRSDVWSCGIILCMLLIGFNPFRKLKQEATIWNIEKQEIDFNAPEWSRASSKVKKLLAKMLQKQPQKRISMEQFLQDDWIKTLTSEEMTSSFSEYQSDMVLKNIREYNRGSNFICYIKNFLISRQLTQSQRQEMAQIFEILDTDSSGVIEKKQLLELYSLVKGSAIQDIQYIIQKIDQNKSGQIDFQQFLICMVKDETMYNKKNIQQAFDYLDDDRTGFIEREELQKCLEGCDKQEIIKTFKEADFNGDGKISREQFVNYMMNLEI